MLKSKMLKFGFGSRPKRTTKTSNINFKKSINICWYKTLYSIKRKREGKEKENYVTPNFPVHLERENGCLLI
jgi:hypothetical protein